MQLLLLQPYSFGEVLDRNHAESAMARRDWIYDDFVRESPTIFSPPVGVQALLILWETVATLAEHEQLERLSDQLTPVIPKQLFDFRIHEHDFALFIRNNHPARRRLHRELESFLGLL